MSSQVILATAGYDHTIRFWEATTGHCYRTLQYPDSQVNKLEITTDKQWLAAAGNPHIKLYEVSSHNPQPTQTYDVHTSNVTAVGFHKEGKWMFSGSEDGTIKVFDIRAPGAQQEYISRGPVTSVELHPNQEELISGRNIAVIGVCCGDSTLHNTALVDYGDACGNLRVWDLTAGACACELVPDVGTSIRSVSIAMDGGMVIAANNQGVCYAWKIARGATTYSTHFEPHHKLHAHQGKYILKCLLSPDSKQLVTTASDNTVKLWNVDTFACLKTLYGHQKWVWDCVFSVDGAYLVTASSDCSARLWDLASGEAIRQYSSHNKAVVCCALNDSAVEA